MSKADSVIPGITSHWRYPQDIFTVQIEYVPELPPAERIGFLYEFSGLEHPPKPGLG